MKKLMFEKKLITTLFAFLFVFLISCQPSEDQINASTTKEPPSEKIFPETSSENLPSDSLPSSANFPSSSQCTDGWVCLSSTQKLHRLANCSFAERETCKFGCFNDTCKPAPVCTSGFKCKNNLEKGYQLEDCSWMSRSKCDYGCKDAECQPKLNATESASSSSNSETTSSTTPASTAPSYPVIAVGEKKVISAGEKEHNLSIYILEPDQVRLQLDSFKSEWISESGNYTFGFAGVTFVIRGIFFQSFEGGKREVTYEILN